MSKASIVSMKDNFREQLKPPLKLFVTTTHDKYYKQEGNGGIVVIAPCDDKARELVDLVLKKHGLFPYNKVPYDFRVISTKSPYSEIICDAPVNGGPDPRSVKARAKSLKKRELGDPLLFISFDHNSHVPGVAGAIAVADDFVLAGELIDASLARRGLMTNIQRSYGLQSFSLKTEMVEMLTIGS